MKLDKRGGDEDDLRWGFERGVRGETEERLSCINEESSFPWELRFLRLVNSILCVSESGMEDFGRRRRERRKINGMK